MKIGDPVNVRFLAEADYPIEGDKVLRRWVRRLPIQTKGYYVGYTYKREGVYSERIGTVSSIIDLEPDYEPWILTNIKSIKLFRIKFSERGNDRFAFPEDVELEDGRRDNYERTADLEELRHEKASIENMMLLLSDENAALHAQAARMQREVEEVAKEVRKVENYAGDDDPSVEKLLTRLSQRLHDIVWKEKGEEL